MTPARYELTSIADVLTVPAERREALFKELHLALLTMEVLLGDKARAAFKPPFVWTDDGDSSVDIKINGDAMRLQVTPAGSATAG